MVAAIVFATLSALSSACGAVLQRLAVLSCWHKPAGVDARSATARPLWRSAFSVVRQPAWLFGALFLIGTFGFQALAAAFVKQSVDVLAHGGLPGLLTHWACYAMIATGALGTVLLQGAYAAGPLAASQSALLIVDPLASIALGAELFHEQLRTGPVYLLGAVVSLAVLAAGVVMLSIWAPPAMTAGELDRLPGQARSGKRSPLQEAA